MKRLFLLTSAILLPALLSAADAPAVDKGLDKLVKPFFAQHCVSCHDAC